jgi:hypothetical protein
MRITRLVRLAPVLILAVAAAACATLETIPSATVTTLDPAGSRYFKLDWTAGPAGASARYVDGYIVNTYGEAAQVQLLAQGLDAAGQVVDQRIDYPVAPVPGLGRAYFHIGPLAAADHCQVTVWSAYFIQGRKIP